MIAERGVNALIGALGVCVLGGSGLTIPHRDPSASEMLAMAGSNEALRYVSYPTQVLSKSRKMVPVMAGGIVLGGKRYSAFEYLQVLLITVGGASSSSGKKKKGGEDSVFGLLLIGFSLVMDAVTGGLQDKVKARTKDLNPDAGDKPVPTMHESMLWTNLSGFLVAAVLALATGQLGEGVSFCVRNPECSTRSSSTRSPPPSARTSSTTPSPSSTPSLTTVTTTRKTSPRSTPCSATRRTASRWASGAAAACSSASSSILRSRRCPKKKPPVAGGGRPSAAAELEMALPQRGANEDDDEEDDGRSEGHRRSRREAAGAGWGRCLRRRCGYQSRGETTAGVLAPGIPTAIHSQFTDRGCRAAACESADAHAGRPTGPAEPPRLIDSGIVDERPHALRRSATQ